MTRVTSLREVSKQVREDGEHLCLQQAVYDYGEGNSDIAFRFIRRSPEGKLKAQRGQAGIPELDDAMELIKKMKKIYVKQMGS